MRSEGYGSCSVCLCVCPRPSSATGATQRQSRHTGGLSIVFTSVKKRRFSYNRFLAKLEFSCYSQRYKSAILQTEFLRACVYIQRTRLSRGAHVNLEAHRVVDFPQSPVGYAPQEGMSAV